jgi:hypothetical protein
MINAARRVQPNRRDGMIVGILVVGVVFGLVGAVFGYFTLPLLSDLLGVPPTYWGAHPRYLWVGAIVGFSGGVLLFLCGLRDFADAW